MRAVSVVALAALFAFAALAPVLQNASADHVYTHRYIIQGRVIDDEGRPVQGAIVQAELKGWFPQDEGVEGPCPQEQAGQRTGERTFVAQTSALGDYRFCIHAHQLLKGGSVILTVGNVTFEEPKDTAIRTTFAAIEVPAGSVGQVGDVAAFEAETGIRGRLWQPLSDDQSIEGIPAQGVAIARAPLKVTFSAPDGSTETQNTTTNNYGEFGVRFDHDGDLEGASFTIEWRDRSWDLDADPKFRVMDEDIVVDKELDVGKGSPGAGVVLTGALLALAALVVGRRRR